MIGALCSLLPAIAVVPAGQPESAKSNPLDEPLITDRPDATESTDAVPAGYLQLEAGYTFTYDREGAERSRNHTAPEMLLRIGLVEDLELRIGWDGYSWTESQSRTATPLGAVVTRETWSQGGNDLSLGLKYKFAQRSGYVPDLGVLTTITVPTGGGGISSGDVDPEIVLLWAYDLTDSAAMSGNVGVAWPSNDGGRFVQAFATLSFGFALNDRVGTYVEYFGLYPGEEHVDAAHSVNTGITYLVNNDFQIDIRIGAGLNEQADDFFAGMGFAWRFAGAGR